MSDFSTTAASAWRRTYSTSVRVFHSYASWLVSISWKRFWVLSLLLLIASGIAGSLLPSPKYAEWADVPPPPAVPKPPKLSSADKDAARSDRT
jgi:hypothetical protein